MTQIKEHFRSIWTWLILLGLVMLTSLFIFQRNLSENGQVTSTLITMPTTEFVVTARGIIDVKGGLVNLSAERTGLIETVLVEAGDIVEVGQVLATQDDREEQNRLRDAVISLENADIQLRRQLLDLEIAVRDMARGKIQRQQDAISQSQFEALSDAVKRAELAIESQEGTIAKSKLSVETSRHAVTQRTLRAPVDGKIVKLNISPGSGVSSQNVSTAIVILPLGDRIIRVDVADTAIADIFVGQDATISAIADPTKTYPAYVESIATVYSNVLEQSEQARNTAGTIEVLVNVGEVPLTLGQEVLVRFSRSKAARNRPA